MVSRQWIAVGCIAAGLAGGAWALIHFSPETARLEVGAKAPDFRVYDLATSDTISLRASYKGSVTLVNIWATWCVPCRAEMPAMERIYDSLGSKGFRIAAVSIDVQGPEAVRKFTDGLHLTFDILQDPAGSIQRAYQTTAVPMSFLLNRDGIIIKRFFGPHEWDSPGDVTVIERLLAEPAT
jgi:peroxiredoxin